MLNSKVQLQDPRLNCSIIISTFNRSKMVCRAIQSVIDQDYPEHLIEIIVVDDGSTDNTKEVVSSYQPRVKYYYQDNRGHGAALNLGYEKSSGDIIFLLDSDDSWNPLKVSTVTEVFQRHPVEAIFHNMNVGENENEIHPHRTIHDKKQFEHIELEKDVYVYTAGAIGTEYCFRVDTSAQSYRRTFCAEIFPLPEAAWRNPDEHLHICALAEGDIYFINKILATQFQHRGQWSNEVRRDTELFAQYVSYLEFTLEHLKKIDLDSRVAAIIQYKSYSLFRAQLKLCRLRRDFSRGISVILNSSSEMGLELGVFGRFDHLAQFISPSYFYSFITWIYSIAGIRFLKSKVLSATKICKRKSC